MGRTNPPSPPCMIRGLRVVMNKDFLTSALTLADETVSIGSLESDMSIQTECELRIL